MTASALAPEAQALERPRVLVAEKIGDSGIDLLKEHFDVDVGIGLSREELTQRIGDYDGILIRSATKLDAELLSKAGRLRAVGRAGVGVDNVDVPAATKRGIVDAEALAKCKDGVRVLNVARGPLVVEDDLKAALDSGKVAGAALDVFSSEPATEHPLFGYPNVIVTPHLGASTAEATDRAGYQAA